ncbi:hypothetical protein [Thermosyntropha sp.]|nr:hypothetical protein [Thermosyntropha sp.]MBO8159815.1 hypothetical protein [Thermosyntropha sp.]
MRSYFNGVLLGAILGAAAAVYLQERKTGDMLNEYKGKARRTRRVLNLI